MPETCSNIGTGNDGTLFNATYPTLWALQDTFHYNFLNGFDLYENGNAGAEIRVPIGHSFSQSGYTLTSSNVAGKWHNGAETDIEFPTALSSVQDATPISSLTNNGGLEWVNGAPRGFTLGNNITEVTEGTRFYNVDGSACVMLFPFISELGKSYNFFIKVVSNTGAGIKIVMTGDFQGLTSSTTGTLTPTAQTTHIELNRVGITDTIISKLYVWEEGTVPPLSYEEMESNFNGADIVFSNTEENKKKKIVAYNSARTTDEIITIQKCTDMKTGIDVLNDVNGPVYSPNGLLVLIP